MSEIERAFQRIWQQRLLSQADLDIIVDAVCIDDVFACRYLGKLATRHPEACTAIEQLASHPTDTAKVNASRCINEATPRVTVLSVLRRLMADQSPNVRSATAWRAAELKCRELIVDVERQIAVESDDGARRLQKLVLQLLRDGYAVETRQDGQKDLHVLCRQGVISTVLAEDELERFGLDRIVRQWQHW